jgi:hypothetical protein
LIGVAPLPEYVVTNPLLYDLRFAARGLRRSPGLTTAIVPILGVAIGAAVAMMAVTRAVVIERLQREAPRRHEEPKGTAMGTRNRILLSSRGHDGGSFASFVSSR